MVKREMAERFVVVDRQTPMFLPPDLREWVAENDLVRLILEAVEQTDLRVAATNVRGSGSLQYPPGMMPGAVNLVLCAGLVQLPPD